MISAMFNGCKKLPENYSAGQQQTQEQTAPIQPFVFAGLERWETPVHEKSLTCL
jgi:hypothetical protein